MKTLYMLAKGDCERKRAYYILKHAIMKGKTQYAIPCCCHRIDTDRDSRWIPTTAGGTVYLTNPDVKIWIEVAEANDLDYFYDGDNIIIKLTYT